MALMATGAADLVSAFHIELKNNVQVPKKSMLELRNYKTNVSWNILPFRSSLKRANVHVCTFQRVIAPEYFFQFLSGRSVWYFCPGG